MSETPPPPTRRRRQMIAAAVGIAAVGGWSSVMLWRQVAVTHAAAFVPADWHRLTVAGVNLEAPCTLKVLPGLLETLPPEVRELIATHESFFGELRSHELKLTVLRVRYTPEVALSLEGAAEETVKNVAAALGDHDPASQMTPLQVSGAEARKIVYHHEAKGGQVHLQALLVVRGQELWEVQTLHTAESFAEEAERILSSVALAEPGAAE